jgi:hypothetical protein
MDRVRHALITALVAAGLAVVPSLAAAQHCHIPAGESPHADHGDEHAAHRSPWWLRASAAVVAGATDVMGEARDYEGLSARLQAGRGRLSGQVGLSTYRIGGSGVGLGDASAAAAVDVAPRGSLRAGLAASMTVPTGDADTGRGMGHVMVAGGAWARLERGRARLSVATALAAAIGENSEHLLHQHQAAGWPLVDPMNPREVVTVARATGALVPGGLDAGVQLTHAVPVMLDGSDRRVAAFLAQRTLGRYAVEVLIEAPLVGDPFVSRGLVEVSYRFSP